VAEAARAPASYSVRRIGLDEIERRVPPCETNEPRFPMQDPEWVKGYFADQLEKLSTYSVSGPGDSYGAATFVVLDWPLTWYLGEFAISELPLKRLLLLEGAIDMPDDAAAYDALFAELQSRSDFGCIHFDAVPVESFLWNYLQSGDAVRQGFVAYQPVPQVRRPLLRFDGTFDSYLQKFGSKHRNTIRRKIKKLRESPLGEMRLVRYETPEQVPEFLDRAVEISRKTYQWRLHQRGLSATEKLRRRLTFAAQHGWMRCYLLFCGTDAIAFLLGYQHDGRFLLDEIGHDPELSKYSAGTVLQYLVVEDLFAHDRPAIWDLQAYGEYKEVLSTESYLEGKMLLFKRGLYSRLLITGDRVFRTSSNAASRLLNRWNLKSKVRNVVRNRGWRQAQ
jgi:GNAT acetyltransferase-like protein